MDKLEFLSDEYLMEKYEFTKNAFKEITNKIRSIINQPEIHLLIKIAEDKKLNHYSYIYGSVKNKRLKKKFKNKFDIRLNEIKEK